MDQAYENLLTRRSCRKYDEKKQVPEETLDKIILAGEYAPTGMGLQSPIIVALTDPESVAELEKLNSAAGGRPGGRPFYGAPTVLVVFGDPDSRFCLDDGNLVIGNLLNAANALGVDSCYIWRARETFATAEGKALMARWGVPEKYVGVGNVILGYGLEGGKRPAAPRKAGYVIKVK
ncbi:MAG: nitroreductase family protein [Clostridia bacterium]|nr:nitroreductase family protein [Clostridia bacterium]